MMRWSGAVLVVAAALAAAAGAIAPARATTTPKAVTSLPGYSGTLREKMYTGFLTANKTSGTELFWWLTESRSATPDTDPLVLWLTGGPGCSSVFAMFQENGPLSMSVDGSETLEQNPYSWNENANVLFVEQPAGTGFSFCNVSGNPASQDCYVTTAEEVVDQMYTALLEWFSVMPKYKGRKFYLTGESFGGAYIPQLSARILAEAPADINMRALAVGNPCLDPYFDLLGHVVGYTDTGFMSKEQYARCEPLLGECKTAFAKRDQHMINQTCNVIFDIVFESFPWGTPNAVDIYDNRVMCTPDSKQPECLLLAAPDLTTWLNKKEVRAAIGVPDMVPTWMSCNDVVFNRLYPLYHFYSTRQAVEKLLTAGIPYWQYHGQNDMRCGFRGGDAFLQDLEWADSHEFKNAPRKNWMVNDVIHGYRREGGGVTSLLIILAGHMAPARYGGQPQAALQMLTEFIASN